MAQSGVIDRLSEALLERCSAETRRDLGVEVEALIRRYAPGSTARDLRAMAATLEAAPGMTAPGRRRLMLWSALLRERADEAERQAQV